MTRLERFRAVVAALDPTAPPKAALDGGLYVAPPSSVTETLVHRLALAPNSTNLLLGHIGGGKTTTLLRAARALRDEVKEAGDRVFYEDVARRHCLDTEPLEGVLVALAGMDLIPATPLGSPIATAADEAAEEIRKHARGYTEWVTDDDDRADWGDGPDEGDDGLPMRAVRHPGAIRSPMAPLPSRLRSLIKPLEALRAGRHAIFFFDSLDRLTSPGEFRTAVEHDLRALRQAGIGVVVAGPIRYALGHDRTVYDLFDHVHVLPAADPSTPEGERFLCDVLRLRAPGSPPDGLFEEPERALIARASGGVLRHLVGLARSAAEEAYAGGAASVTAGHIEAAVQTLGDSLAFGLDDAQLAAVTKLMQGGGFVIRGEQELALLDSARIVFRRPGTFEVHPALSARLSGTRIAA
ncbi:MAG: hypothetical protein HY908_17320 [Myxococcales bacterium]|nr:hypothetical protein [Myxococcales bacterium]